ncbi:MAG: phosphate transport system regulatory protein PhoU [Syntrophobacteraceae bacterium CG2_30_61_12]|nr:MAG: phosphate transport system regulatory protein PhoU [Syntrophobacteraceae bacterium CG2_30_61_12]
MHMESRFHQEQEELRLTILRMAALSERIMEKALRALFERNLEMSAEVIQEDQEINNLDMQVDRFVLKLLALGQPMARDLRFIVGCMRIGIDLERIGDQAVNIAHRARYLTNRPPLPPSSAMRQLAETAMDMLHLALDAFINENVEQAMEVCQMDDEADRLNVQALEDLMGFMANDTPAIQRAMHTIIAARCLERVADHATNIAESLCFIAQGVNMKHQCK